MKKSIALILIAFSVSTAALAKERIRFDCKLMKEGRTQELEAFVLRPHESTQQFVTPERKFFIDLKEVQMAIEVDQPPPAAPVVKQIPGLRLILWVYSDFTAKYESTETLMVKASDDFPFDSKLMKVVARAEETAEPAETYHLKCEKLEKVVIPKIVIEPNKYEKKKKKLPTAKEIDEI